MLEKDTLIKAKNRSNGHVVYKIDDLGVRRDFRPGEVKELTLDELRKLSYSSGGLNILRKYLVLNNEEAVKELIGRVEPEYYYSKKDIDTLLKRGSMNQLLDCLDFAPQGVIHLLKERAVILEISDLRKRKAIKDATGFDVDRAIHAIEETRAAALDMTEDKPEKKRRSAPINEKENEEPKPKRRTTKQTKTEQELEEDFISEEE